MADEEIVVEGQDTEEPEVVQETSDSETTAEETTQQAEGEGYEAKYKELQSEHDKLKQEHTQSEQYLNMVSDYIDYGALRKSQGAAADTESPDEESEGTFVTRKQQQEFEQRIDNKLRTAEGLRKFREQYPDLADDGGPKEALVNFFLQNKTLQRDPPAQRVKRAVEMAREYLGNLKKEGEVEATAKSTKNAQAMGLSSTQTTPAKEEKTQSASISDYKKIRQVG